MWPFDVDYINDIVLYDYYTFCVVYFKNYFFVFIQFKSTMQNVWSK